jgi:hypothetical protein
MLRAINTNKQSDAFKRLWFNDQDHDLFLWLDSSMQPVSFQFSYRTYSDIYSEHVISWKKGMGYTHDKIDDGEPADGDYKMTPILVPDGAFDYKKIAQRFKSISKDIDEDIRDFIYQKLCNYPQET